MQLDLFDFDAGRGPADQDFAKTRSRGAERYINVVDERFAFDLSLLCSLLGHILLADKADNAIVERTDLNGFGKRILIREKALRKVDGEDADIVLVDFIRLRKEAAAHDVESNNSQVGGQGPQNLAGGRILREPHVVANDAHRQHM